MNINYLRERKEEVKPKRKRDSNQRQKNELSWQKCQLEQSSRTEGRAFILTVLLSEQIHQHIDNSFKRYYC